MSALRLSMVESLKLKQLERCHWPIMNFGCTGLLHTTASDSRRPLHRSKVPAVLIECKWMKGQKMWQVKESRVRSLRQGKRSAEGWCAARLYPGLPLLETVARLTEGTSAEPSPTIPRSPTTAEKQQADRLHAAAVAASARVLEALGPIRPPLRTDS